MIAPATRITPESLACLDSFLREYGDCAETAFDAHKFWVTENGKDTQQSVEGHMFYYRYRLKQGLPDSSPLQIIRNYQNAARAAGGKILIRRTVASPPFASTKGGKELWLDVAPSIKELNTI